MQVIPLGLRFGFDLKPFAEKFGIRTKGLLELVYEPYIGGIISPDSNVEFALPFFLKYGFPLTDRFYPYIEAGTGPYYMSLQTYEQSTQFNFVSAGGAGVIFFLKDDLALNAGARYRHVSNASIKEPNGGIEAWEYLLGVSLYY